MGSILLFIGHLVLADDSLLAALVVSVVTGVVYGVFVLWLSRHERIN